MDANDRVEKARIEREARDAVTAPGRGGSAAVEAALKRYLAAEQYHEHDLEEREDEVPEHDSKSKN